VPLMRRRGELIGRVLAASERCEFGRHHLQEVLVHGSSITDVVLDPIEGIDSVGKISAEGKAVHAMGRVELPVGESHEILLALKHLVKARAGRKVDVSGHLGRFHIPIDVAALVRALLDVTGDTLFLALRHTLRIETPAFLSVQLAHLIACLAALSGSACSVTRRTISSSVLRLRFRYRWPPARNVFLLRRR